MAILSFSVPKPALSEVEGYLCGEFSLSSHFGKFWLPSFAPQSFFVALLLHLCLPSNWRPFDGCEEGTFMCTARSPLIIPTCNYILDSGPRCRGAAVAGRPYCRHHLDSRFRLRRMARMRRRNPILQCPLLADEAAIRYATVHIDAGLSDGRIDRDAGPALLWALQMAQDLIKATDRSSPFSSAVDNPMRLANRGKPSYFYHVPTSPLNRRT
jgi:hypothetical protein